MAVAKEQHKHSDETVRGRFLWVVASQRLHNVHAGTPDFQ